MPRSEIRENVVNDLTGTGIDGASVEIRNRVDNSLATIYAAETGSTTLTNPLISSRGKITGWLDNGSYDLYITGNRVTPSHTPIEAWSGQTVASGGGGGAVASVNGFTGTVVLNASDVGADASGAAATAQAASQPLDSDLTAIAALSTTSFGRGVLTETSATTLKTTLGVNNVDNTSDVNKPISTATQTALNTKGNTLVLTPVKTTNYTLSANEFGLADTTAPFTFTLPTAPADRTRAGAKIVLPTSSPGTLTVACGGSDTFNVASGTTTRTLSLPGQYIELEYAAGSPGSWVVIGEGVSLTQLDARYDAAGAATAAQTAAVTAVTPIVVNLGSTPGATSSLTLSPTTLKQVRLTLNANHVATIPPALGPGAKYFIMQPASGGPWTFSVNDGTTTQAITINPAAQSLTEVWVEASSGTTLDVGVVGIPSSGVDATTSTKGVVQLAGDLAGTAAAPTVPALTTLIPLTQKGANSGVASLNSSGVVPIAQLATGTPTGAKFVRDDNTLQTVTGSVVADALVVPPGYTNPDATPSNVLFVPRISRRVRWDAIPPVGSVRPAFIPTASLLTTAGGAGITKSDDSTITDPILNASAVKIAQTGGGSVYTARPTSAFASTVDISGGKVIQFWMRIEQDVVTNIINNTFVLQLSSDNFSSSNYHQLVLVNAAEAPNHPVGRWHRFSFDTNELAAVGTGATLTAINNFRISLSVVGAGGTGTYYFPPWISFTPRMSPKAKFVIFADDGSPEQFTNMAYEMAKYGFPGVAAFNLAQIGLTSALTFPQLRSLHDQHGWQIGAHSWTNSTHNSLITGDTWESSVAARVRALAAGDGWFGGDHFSYYGGAGVGVKQFTNTQYAQIRRLYVTGRANFQQLRTVETIPVGDPWNLRAFLTATGDTAANWTAYVDKIIAAKGLGMMVWHTNTTGANLPLFQTLLAYLDTNRASIDVVTMQDAIDGLWTI